MKQEVIVTPDLTSPTVIVPNVASSSVNITPTAVKVIADDLSIKQQLNSPISSPKQVKNSSANNPTSMESSVPDPLEKLKIVEEEEKLEESKQTDKEKLTNSVDCNEEIKEKVDKSEEAEIKKASEKVVDKKSPTIIPANHKLRDMITEQMKSKMDASSPPSPIDETSSLHSSALVNKLLSPAHIIDVSLKTQIKKEIKTEKNCV